VIFKISISYDGSQFFGSQKQRNFPTVQGVLEEAIEKVLKQKIKLKIASRTDRFVHARENFCSFEGETKIPLENLKKAINSHLPRSLKILKIERKKKFHPRFDTVSKTYRYFIKTKNFYPYDHNYCWHVPFKLERNRMEKAAKFLVGRKDFRHLSSCLRRENTICDVKKMKISKGENFFIEIEASHFLYKMARTIVSFIVEAGMGKILERDFEKVLLGKTRHISPAPPQGLFLWKIKYK